MDLEQVSVIIERTRILTGLSSLPVLIREGEKILITWFNFFISEDEKEGDFIKADTAFIMDTDMKVTEKKIQITEKVLFGTGEMQKLDEDEYYKALDKLYSAYDEESMMQLLKDGVPEILLPVYQKFLSQIV